MTKPSLRQIEAFLHVYKKRSLTATASEMGISQSAVSLLIKELETSLNVRLFDRTTRALTPTSAAASAFPVTQRIISDVGGLKRHMNDLAAAKAGRVILSSSATVAATLMPDCLLKFRERFPDIEIQMFDVPMEQLIPSILSGDVEFGVGNIEEGHPELSIQTLIKGPLAAIGLRDLPLFKRAKLKWKDLASVAVISMRKGTSLRSQIDDALRQSGNTFVPSFEVSLMNTGLSMTASGLGIFVLPLHLVPLKQYPSLIAVPLVEPIMYRKVTFAHRAGVSLSPAAQAFKSHAIKHFGKDGGRRSA